MLNITRYLSSLTAQLLVAFGSDLLYVGLQGSFLRGEATEQSDIDIMVILESLTVDDLAVYRAIIKSMPESNKSCGFLCSKSDLANWNPLEIWNLVNGTKDYYGRLLDYTPEYTETDIRNYAKLSLNNLYHSLCHSYVHSENGMTEKKLAGAYKNVFFLLQTVYYLSSGKYIPTKAQLLPLLSGTDYAVMHKALSISNEESSELTGDFSLLFTWCQNTLRKL